MPKKPPPGTAAGIETTGAQQSARTQLFDAVAQVIHILQAKILGVAHAPADRDRLVCRILAGRQSTHIGRRRFALAGDRRLRQGSVIRAQR